MRHLVAVLAFMAAFILAEQAMAVLGIAASAAASVPSPGGGEVAL
jgi:hypothetical protein